MASQIATINFILQQMRQAGPVAARKMFGEYGLYLDGKLFGLVCDDQLFIKPTAAGRSNANNLPEHAPYLGAKPCFLVAVDWCEDGDWLSDLVRITIAALPTQVAKRAPRIRRTGQSDK